MGEEKVNYRFVGKVHHGPSSKSKRDLTIPYPTPNLWSLKGEETHQPQLHTTKRTSNNLATHHLHCHGVVALLPPPPPPYIKFKPVTTISIENVSWASLNTWLNIPQKCTGDQMKTTSSPNLSLPYRKTSQKNLWQQSYTQHLCLLLPLLFPPMVPSSLSPSGLGLSNPCPSFSTLASSLGCWASHHFNISCF